jgi:hypothetical protein
MTENAAHFVCFVIVINVRLVVLSRPRVEPANSALAILTSEQRIELPWQEVVVHPAAPRKAGGATIQELVIIALFAVA